MLGCAGMLSYKRCIENGNAHHIECGPELRFYCQGPRGKASCDICGPCKDNQGHQNRRFLQGLKVKYRRWSASKREESFYCRDWKYRLPKYIPKVLNKYAAEAY